MIHNKIKKHFQKVDPILFKAYKKINQPIVLTPHTDYFAALCESIISQQISTKAGDAIWKRFITLFPNQKVSAKFTNTLSVEQLRSIGISNPKAKYIVDLSTKVINEEVHLDRLTTMSDNDIVIELTRVKGIGTWTAEMFMMFTLGREDIFSVKDLGLKRAIQKLYNIQHDPTIEELLQISLPWSPYRTYACMILWRSL